VAAVYRMSVDRLPGRLPKSALNRRRIGHDLVSHGLPGGIGCQCQAGAN